MEQEISSLVAVSSAKPFRAGIFDLVRGLRSLGVEFDPAVLRDIAARWHGAAKPKDKTEEDCYEEMCGGWNLVKKPKGEVMQRIKARAEEIDVPMATSHPAESTRKLIRLCAALQEHFGDKPFFLSQKMAAKLIGVTPTAAKNKLVTLQMEKVLDLVRKGDRPNGASEWRFLASWK